MRTTAFALLGALSCAAQQFRPGRTAPIPPVIGAWPIQQIVVGDVDGDGFDDLVLALDYGGIALLCADRHGGFVDRSASVPGRPHSTADSVSLGDADDDGDLDLVTIDDRSRIVMVCMNQGDGTFVDVSSTFSPVRVPDPLAVTWIDIDGDRLLDVFVANPWGNRLLLQRSGALVDVSATHLLAGLRAMISRLRAVDVDADGDQDLLAFRGPHPLLLNDGTGHFAVPPPARFPAAVWALHGAGDFDGDGRVDVVAYTGQLELWFQTSGGTFVDRTATHFAGITGAWDFFDMDVDGDGDVDLCRSVDLLVNDGTGRFAVAANRWTALLPRGGGMPFGDFDGDGDPDVAVVDQRSSQLVSFNHHRQLSTPTEPVRGGAYAIDYEASPGYATTPTTMLPWFGLAPNALHLPGLGHLGFDPATAVAGPGLVLPAPAGRTLRTLPVPNDPVLAGVALYLQAVAAPGGAAGLRLTNTVADRIR